MTPVTPSSVCDMEREAFEAHVTAVDRQMTINRHPGKSGRYVSDITAVCWGIWQARAALAERTQQEAPSEEQVLRALDTYYQHTRGACGYSDVLISRMRNVLATRPTSAADCTAPMQPSEREAFEVWRRRTTKMVNKDDSVAREGFGGDANYTDRTTRSMWIGWQAHAALAAPTQAAVEPVITEAEAAKSGERLAWLRDRLDTPEKRRNWRAAQAAPTQAAPAAQAGGEEEIETAVEAIRQIDWHFATTGYGNAVRAILAKLIVAAPAAAVPPMSKRMTLDERLRDLEADHGDSDMGASS